MAKTTLTVAKETTSQQILEKVNSIAKEGGGLDFSPVLPRARLVNGPANAAFTATDGRTTFTGTLDSEGAAEVSFPYIGTWVVTVPGASETPSLAFTTLGEVLFDSFVALPRVNVTGGSANAEYTATDGEITLTGTLNSSGAGAIVVPKVGTWTISIGGLYSDIVVEFTELGEVKNGEFHIKTLNEMSWSEIKAISDAGNASSCFNIGDTKTITINGKVGQKTYSNLSIDVFIIGFDHNSTLEGSNRIHFQMGKVNGTLIAFDDGSYNNQVSSTGYFSMNSSNTNSGGWTGSQMRKNILGGNGTPSSPTANSLMAALPADLRAVLKSVTKYTDNNGGGSDTASYVKASTEYLFLLAEYEVFGVRSYANSAEKNYQEQYAYYAAGNSKIAYKQSSSGTAAWWWLRSPYATYYYGFSNVSTDGSSNNSYANSSGGVSAGFCV